MWRAHPDLPAGIPPVDGPRHREILVNDGTCADHNSFRDLHAGVDERLGANPSLFTDRDRLGDQLKVRAVVVMRARAQVRSLGHDGEIANRHTTHGIELGTVPDYHVIAKLQIPRCPDTHLRVDTAPLSQMRAE